MSTTFTNKIIASALLLVVSNTVWAGLGQIQVHSYLGEPFMATIPLTGQTAKDATDPELSTNEQLAVMNVMGSSAASDLKFTIVRRKGAAYIRVTSRAPIGNPILSFGVNVKSVSGTITRQYDALLDIKSTNQLSSPVIANSSQETSTGKGQAKYSNRSYTVQEGDTVHSIAAQYKPSTLTVAQTSRAIVRANPKAFARGNPERLLVGVTLRIPSESRMRSLIAASKKPRVNVSSGSIKRGAEATAMDKTAQSKTSVEQEVIDKAAADKAVMDAKIAAEKLAIDKIATAKVETTASEEGAKIASTEASASGMVASQVETSMPMVDDAEIAQIERELEEASQLRAKKEREASEALAQVQQAPPSVQESMPAEPSMMDVLIKYAPFGIGGLLLLLLGFWGVKKITGRGREQQDFIDDDSFLDMAAIMSTASTKSKHVSSKVEEKITAAVSQMGKNVNMPVAVTVDPNRAPSTFMTDFTRMSAAIDTGEIDPLSEAEVYIAYGRNDEAEEILKEALIKDPAQHEVRKKLLEVYASKQEFSNFESIAKELYDAFDGRGAAWQEIAQMGRALDPNNSLYQQTGKVDARQRNMRDTEVAPLDIIEVEDVVKDIHTQTEAEELAEAEKFDAMFEVGDDDQGISLAHDDVAQEVNTEVAEKEEGNLEFDLDSVLRDAKDAGTLDASSLPAVETIDIDQVAVVEGEKESSVISSLEGNMENSPSFANDPLSTKLELAKVYIDMGDLDGAREVLQELVEDADGVLLHEAEQMLHKLSL